jgi:hypothetical protein
MRFRITLENPVLGSLILTKMPKGIDSIYPTILRSPNHGLTIETDVKLEFYCQGAGKEFIDEVRDTQGIDAEILITIEAFCGCDPATEAPDYSIDYSDDYGSMMGGDCEEGFEDFYLGELEMSTWDTKDGLTKVNIKPRGILETVKNRLDTKIDLQALESLDGDVFEDTFNTPYDLALHSKAIIKKGNYNFTDDAIEDPSIENDDLTPIPEGWTLEGYDYDEVNIPYSGDSGVRTLEHSFSQTIMPEIPILNEISDYTGEANSLERNTTYPANDEQIQNGNLIEVINEAIPENFRVYGKIKWGLIVDFDWIGGNAGEYDVTASLIPKAYLKVGDTITLLETYPEVSGSALIDSIVPSPVPTANVIPLTEYTLEFDESISGVNDGDSIRVYIKFDSVRTAERPETLGQDYDLGMAMYCLFHQDFSEDEMSFIAIEQESIAEESTASAFAIFETGAQIARCIVGENDSFRSNIFGRVNSEPYQYEENGCGSFNAITNGFMIRGYPLTERTVRLSMNDYFKGLNPIWNLGMGIEKSGSNYYIVVDSKEYFYDVDTVLMTINNIPHLLRYESPEHYYNMILAGYDKWEIELTNGLDEVNSKREYYTGIKSVDNKLDLVSSLVSSPYRLETPRRNRYIDSATTDTEYDEDNYIIALNRTEVDGIPTQLDVAEKDENFADVTDLLSPETSYNLRLTPNRNILRWGNVINAGLTKYTGREIKFTSGEGNYKMTSQFDADACPGNWNNEVLSEGQNIQWDDANNTFSDPLWIPEILEFEWPVKFSEFKTIEANPKGVFSISESETGHIKGFILEFKYVPNGRSKFKLLRAFE